MSTSSRRSATASRSDSNKSAYTSNVIATDACPSIRWATFGLAPAEMASDAGPGRLLPYLAGRIPGSTSVCAKGRFVWPDGTVVQPLRTPGGYRHFTLEMIKDIALSSYRHGWFKMDTLKSTLLQLVMAVYCDTGEIPVDPRSCSSCHRCRCSSVWRRMLRSRCSTSSGSSAHRVSQSLSGTNPSSRGGGDNTVATGYDAVLNHLIVLLVQPFSRLCAVARSRAAELAADAGLAGAAAAPRGRSQQ